MHFGSEERNIKVTIILSSGGEFSATFESATDAFLAVHNYLKGDSRDCYYKNNYDDLMGMMLSIRHGNVNKSECSMFRAEGIKKEEN